MNIRGIFITLCALCVSFMVSGQEVPTLKDVPLKDAFGDRFLVGTALNVRQIFEKDAKGAAVAKHHFNSIVAENCMKCEEIHPQENIYNWTEADRFVKFGEDNDMVIIGHCLIWHSQLAPWFCKDDNGDLVSPEVLRKRMKDHITTIVRRYKGRIFGWDVVNEAIEDDGSYRNSDFYRILGEEYIPLAFQFAHEADPNAELYYNDFSMDKPGKRATVVKLVKDLQAKGIRIDAVGMQSHMGLDHPELFEFETSLKAYAETGVKVMITEWDVSALPLVKRGANVGDRVAYRKSLNPYPDGLPENVSKEWNDRMSEIFNIFLKHSDVISRVTAWGISDEDSWKNNWPVRGRTEYPLLFDRDYQMKPFLQKAIKKHGKKRKSK